MTRRRQARLLRTLLALAALCWLTHHIATWWTNLDPYQRSSLALATTSLVLTVWGIAACLREHRLDQLRAAMDRHPARGRRG